MLYYTFEALTYRHNTIAEKKKVLKSSENISQIY